MNQVVTIGADGAISGLQRKKNQGVDLRQFGHAEIERASEIEWVESKQRWCVRILGYSLRCKTMDGSRVLCVRHWHNAGLTMDQLRKLGATFTDVSYEILFQDYDDAVKAEVTFLDRLRKAGTF